MPRVEFQSTIPVFGRAKTFYALASAAAVIGSSGSITTKCVKPVKAFIGRSLKRPDFLNHSFKNSSLRQLCVFRGKFPLLKCNCSGWDWNTNLIVYFHSFINQWLYSPLLGPVLFFSFVFIFTQTVGLLGRVISPWQNRYLHRITQTQNKRTHRHVHASDRAAILIGLIVYSYQYYAYRHL
jgi:hypothetical protein